MVLRERDPRHVFHSHQYRIFPKKKKKKQVCTKVTEVFNDYMNYGFSGKSCFGEKELADSYKLHTF